MNLLFPSVITIALSFIKDSKAQFQVVAYTTQEEELLKCFFKSTTLFASWNYLGFDGSLPRDQMYTYRYVPSSGVSGPERGYEKFNIQYADNGTVVSFHLVITDVMYNDRGVYTCFLSGSNPETSFDLTVEVLPDTFNLTCSKSPSLKCGGPVLTSSVYCTCTATGVSPGTLQLQWSVSPYNVIQNETRVEGAYFNLISEVTIIPTSSEERVTCSLTGYQSEGIDSSLIMRTYDFVPPSCSLEVSSYDDMCTSAELNCKCSGGMPDAYTYSFFFRNKSRMVDSETSKITVNITAGEPFIFYCRGCNGIHGVTTLDEILDVCNTDIITLPSTTPNIKTCDDPTQCSALGLIAICCVEGVVIIAMIFFVVFVYTSRKGSRKEDFQSLALHHHDATEKTNTAYMDLQEITQLSSSSVDVPFENLNLQAPFPGKGAMKYQKAEITLTSETEEIVVKTVSDDAPVRLAKLLSDEVQKLATLSSNANVAQFLGRCNNVPNLLCYQYVNGTKLGEYLRENFQPSKIHQYGNTKRKRFHVPEKGYLESLPGLALQIARGMRYLTAQKFLHPGLRSEKVIIDVSGQCKLYDFVSEDNAKDIITILWSKSVPYQWMPPEYLFLEKLGPSVDVWSFGILMWEIFSYGALPYEGKDRNDVEKELRGQENLPLPNNCPGAIWQIALNCWDQSPKKRPSFDHLSVQLSYMCDDDKVYYTCNDNEEYDDIQLK